MNPINRAGQKVVYIEDRFEPLPWGRDTLLAKDGVYTVKSFVIDELNQVCITLYEVEPAHPVPGWWVGAFRPVDERKTDISEFQKLLKDTPVGVDA